ncbi:MAG: amidase [Renibacterium sp.]|nr:amidase [Renibacterium sp.]
MSSSELHRPWSLRALVAELDSGQTTTAAALECSRACRAATEPRIRAWVGEAEIPARPPGAEPAGLLGGVPLGVKDIIDVAGFPTRCGSELRAHAPPATEDAAIVAAWRAAGALPTGKTVSTEFAYFAPGPTTNPAAPGHTPGGSSSGSAAAVAAGQVPLALGSQTAGSVIRPAAYCGVAAMVLSQGLVPLTGVTGLSPSLDSHGFFAASVSDLALAWAAFSGQPDIGSETVRSPPRVLLWAAETIGTLEPAMTAALRELGQQLRAAGAQVEDELAAAPLAQLAIAHPVIMAYEAARERSAELAQLDRLSEPLAKLLRSGAQLPLPHYRAAQETLAAGQRWIAEESARFDVVLGPAALGAAPRGLAATGDPILSRPWQALGLPVVAVPGCTDDQGLPLGVQVVGLRRDETELLRHARWVEQVLDGLRPTDLKKAVP